MELSKRKINDSIKEPLPISMKYLLTTNNLQKFYLTWYNEKRQNENNNIIMINKYVSGTLSLMARSLVVSFPWPISWEYFNLFQFFPFFQSFQSIETNKGMDMKRFTKSHV